jgi:hypothetical protein
MEFKGIKGRALYGKGVSGVWRKSFVYSHVKITCREA